MALVVVLAAAGSVAVGCSGGTDDEACDELALTHNERRDEADTTLDELLAHREAVALHDRTHHDLQFDHAKAVVQREAARQALDEAGCELD